MAHVKRRRFLTRIALAAASTAAIGTPARAQSANLIRIGTGPDPATTPVLYGVSAGLYQKAGLTVEPMVLANGAAAMAAVSGGSLDVGKNSTVATISTIAKGVPFTAIGSLP